MQRKILSLILSAVLLSQISCFGTFTVNTWGFTVGQHGNWKPICKDYPKNQYNETVNLNCAFMELVNNQRLTDGMSPGFKPRVGPNGDYEIRLWHVNQLRDAAPELARLIHLRNKDVEKNNYKKSLIDSIKNFFYNSTEDAEEITNKILDKDPIFRNKAMTKDDWEGGNGLISPIKESEINRWRQEHNDLVKQYKIEKCNWFEKKFEEWFNASSCKEKVDNEVRKFLNSEIRKNEIKGDSLSSGFIQIFRSMLNGHYEGQDTLVLLTDYTDDNYGAKVYFENIGLGENKKIHEKDVKPFLDYYSTDNNKNDKEEL